MRNHLIRAWLLVGPPVCFLVGLTADDLATLLARAAALAGVGAVLYIGVALGVHRLLGIQPLEVECPECDGVGAACCSGTGKADTLDDPGAEWDRARDRHRDADLWPVVA